ncbi:MAG: hypothetical protein ABIS86_03110 [Streptosporangiaceae bacterium]
MIRTTAAVALAAGSVVLVLGAPAEAAAPRCAIGTWKLTKATIKVDSVQQHLRLVGGAGATLRLDGRTALHGYNRSKRLAETGTTGGAQVRGWLQYRKTLRMKTKVPSGRSGTLISSIGSATGNATIRLHQSRPFTNSPGPKLIVYVLRNGDFDGGLPRRAGFTCTSAKLRLKQRLSTSIGVVSSDWTYRRLR